jgi:hypothetical protein
MRDIRLGDDIDDFCVRCKRVTNHVVVSVLNNAPAKVRCRTCHSDHDFRNEQAPPPKVDLRKQALFNEVLKKAVPGAIEVDGEALTGDPLQVPDLGIDEAGDDELALEGAAVEDPVDDHAAVEDIAAEAVAGGVKTEAPKRAAKVKTKARK